MSSIVSVFDLVFVGTYGYVSALHKHTGKEIWRSSLKGTGYSLVTLQPDLHGRFLFCGSRGIIIALSPSNGVEIWRNELAGDGYQHISLMAIQSPLAGSSSSPSSPMIMHHALPPAYPSPPAVHHVAATAPPPPTHDQVDKFSLPPVSPTPAPPASAYPPRPPPSGGAPSSPTYHPDPSSLPVSAPVMMMAGAPPSATQLYPSPAGMMPAPVPAPQHHVMYASPVPVIDLSNILYLATAGNIEAIDMTSGKRIWTSSMGFRRVVTMLHEDGLILAGSAGAVVALDPLSGRVIWRNDLPGLNYQEMTLSTMRQGTNYNTNPIMQALAMQQQKQNGLQ
eukprot:TRINITY_DN62_c0_g1_i1.p1 TRINITY_DN62_c0_g1~~TRINITY_DN62_c0_g1_i1.p1  ORF type:complete len:389 (+),score=97.89 TRINITY_DN62_c0_g1_i1:160-1167(+)